MFNSKLGYQNIFLNYYLKFHILKAGSHDCHGALTKYANAGITCTSIKQPDIQVFSRLAYLTSIPTLKHLYK